MALIFSTHIYVPPVLQIQAKLTKTVSEIPQILLFYLYTGRAQYVAATVENIVILCNCRRTRSHKCKKKFWWRSYIMKRQLYDEQIKLVQGYVLLARTMQTKKGHDLDLWPMTDIQRFCSWSRYMFVLPKNACDLGLWPSICIGFDGWSRCMFMQNLIKLGVVGSWVIVSTKKTNLLKNNTDKFRKQNFTFLVKPVIGIMCAKKFTNTFIFVEVIRGKL